MLQLDRILEAALGMNHEESMVITQTIQFEAGLFLSDWRTLSDWFVEIPDGMLENLGMKLMHLFLSCDALPSDLKVYYVAVSSSHHSYVLANGCACPVHHTQSVSTNRADSFTPSCLLSLPPRAVRTLYYLHSSLGAATQKQPSG